MAPKRSTASDEALVGHNVLVPQSEWPELKPPRNQKGWKGTVASVRKEGGYFVRFPGDPQKYSFPEASIRSWLIPEPAAQQQQQQPAAPASAKRGGATPAKRAAGASGAAAAAPTPGRSGKKARSNGSGGGGARPSTSSVATVAGLQDRVEALARGCRDAGKLEQAVKALERILG